MATKPELEATVERQRVIINTQERAVRELLADAGMEVHIPSAGWEHNQAMSHAPYIGDRNGKNDPWRHRFMKVVFDTIRKHCPKVEHGIGSADYMDFCESHNGSGERYVMPRVCGEFLAELLNAGADFGCECYGAGVESGSNLLKRLASQEITQEDFDDQYARQIGRKQSDWRRFGSRPYDHKRVKKKGRSKEAAAFLEQVKNRK